MRKEYKIADEIAGKDYLTAEIDYLPKKLQFESDTTIIIDKSSQNENDQFNVALNLDRSASNLAEIKTEMSNICVDQDINNPDSRLYNIQFRKSYFFFLISKKKN